MTVYIINLAKTGICSFVLKRQPGRWLSRSLAHAHKLLHTLSQANPLQPLKGKVVPDDAYLGGLKPANPAAAHPSRCPSLLHSPSMIQASRKKRMEIMRLWLSTMTKPSHEVSRPDLSGQPTGFQRCGNSSSIRVDRSKV